LYIYIIFIINRSKGSYFLKCHQLFYVLRKEAKVKYNDNSIFNNNYICFNNAHIIVLLLLKLIKYKYIYIYILIIYIFYIYLKKKKKKNNIGKFYFGKGLPITTFQIKQYSKSIY